MKKTYYLVAILVLALMMGLSLSAFAQQNSAAMDVITNHYAARNFIAGAIPQADLDRIIQAGIRAPSASNRQPWHFIVVRDLTLARRILPQTVDGNVLIVVSAQGDGRTNGVAILDCALAVQSINLAAQALGYGSRIYTGRNNAINDNKTALGMPSGHSVVAMVQIGRIQGPVDAVSSASARNRPETMVTYK
jgi:nitroreductase